MTPSMSTPFADRRSERVSCLSAFADPKFTRTGYSHFSYEGRGGSRLGPITPLLVPRKGKISRHSVLSLLSWEDLHPSLP